MDVLKAFLADPAGIAAKAMLGLAFLDAVLGTFAAVRDGTFDTTATGAFLAKHVLGRVVPITVLLAGGYLTGDMLISGGAVIAAGVYANETRKSLLESIGQIMTGDAGETGDEVPQE